MATDSQLTFQRSLIEQLTARLGNLPPLRLAEVVKPPGGSAEKASRFTLARLDDGSVGAAWNLLDDDRDRDAYDRWSGADRLGCDALEVARDFLRPERERRILGYACCNALSQVLLREGRLAADPDADLFGILDLGPSDHAGLVGFSPPLIRRLGAGAGELTVLERAPREVRGDNVHVRTDPAALSRCNKVLVTSTTLLNDTFSAIEELTRAAEVRALYGPGAGVFPPAFFALGFHAVAGIEILAPDALVDRQRRGQRWGDAKRKCLFTP